MSSYGDGAFGAGGAEVNGAVLGRAHVGAYLEVMAILYAQTRLLQSSFSH